MKLLRNRRLLLLAFLGLVLVLPGGEAQAASAGTVLILTRGDDGDRNLLHSNAQAALHEKQVGVTPVEDASLAGFEAGPALECLLEEGACADLLRRVPAEWVLLLEIVRASSDADADLTVVGRLFAASDGNLLQAERRICERCTSSERLARVVGDLVRDISGSEIAHKAKDTYLQVDSTPEGAILSIDGKVVGPTGQLYRVSPGEHRLDVHSDGYESASQSVSIARNERKSVTIRLDARAEASPSLSPRQLVGSVALGSGLLGLGAGAVWLALDGDPVGNDDGARDELRETSTLGVTSVLVGAAFVGAGTYLLLTGDSDPDDVQVMALPSTEGMSVGLSGRF